MPGPAVAAVPAIATLSPGMSTMSAIAAVPGVCDNGRGNGQ